MQLPLAALLLRSPFAHGVGKWIDDIMATIGNYPLSILPVVLRGIFTYVLPLAFVAYFPVLVLLDREPEHGPLAWLAPWSCGRLRPAVPRRQALLELEPAPLPEQRRLK